MPAVMAGLIGLLLLVTGALAGAPAAQAKPAPERAFGNTTVFSKVPSPGFPAYVYAHPNGRVYAGTYTNPSGDAYRSRVFEWSKSGTLLRSWTVPGQDLAAAHGVQVATSDAAGRLVLLEKSASRVLTLNVKTGKFRTRATIPSPGGAHAIPNYAAWGPDGSLYVTDYGQAVIWRIAPGTRKPKAWFTSKALAGLSFGTTGIVYHPKQRAFLITQQTTTDPLDLMRGHLYRLPLKADGKPGELSTLWTSGPMDLPDGFGIARSGNIYVSLLGTNQIVQLSPKGKTLAKIGTMITGANGGPIPFDSPSNATFLGKRLLVANQSAMLGTAANHAVLDVYVRERGLPIFIPRRAKLG